MSSTRRCSVVVITVDSESTNPSSTLGSASFFSIPLLPPPPPTSLTPSPASPLCKTLPPPPNPLARVEATYFSCIRLIGITWWLGSNAQSTSSPAAAPWAAACLPLAQALHAGLQRPARHTLRQPIIYMALVRISQRRGEAGGALSQQTSFLLARLAPWSACCDMHRQASQASMHLQGAPAASFLQQCLPSRSYLAVYACPACCQASDLTVSRHAEIARILVRVTAQLSS